MQREMKKENKKTTKTGKTAKSSKQASEKKITFFGVLRDTVMVLINLAVVLLLLLSAKLPILSPEQLTIAAYPNYLLLFFAVVNILFFLYWLFRLRYWAVMSLLAFVICFQEQKDWFPLHVDQEDVSLSKKEYKLLTYNTMQFSSMKPHSAEAPNKVLKYLQDSQADIICLQEANCHTSSKYLQSEDVLRALSAYPYQRVLPGKKLINMWVFSKYPIIKCERIPFESIANASYYCDIKIDGKIIRVINNHLESNKLNQADKNIYKDIIDKPDKESISHVATHLNGKLAPAAVLRAKQAETVARVIEESPYPVIVCGDFNDIPNSYTYRKMSKGLEDAWVNNANGLGITYHEHFFLFRIDYILHSPSIKTYQTQIDKVSHSDHYPLWTYFQL